MAQLRTAELYQDDECKIIAVESIELSRSKFKHCGQLYASITPLVVIVCTADGNRVLALDERTLENLKQTYPELDELISNTCAA